MKRVDTEITEIPLREPEASVEELENTKAELLKTVAWLDKKINEIKSTLL